MENTIDFAEWLHDNYEELAKITNWNTKQICRVKFKDLPRENKILMIKLANRIIERFL